MRVDDLERVLQKCFHRAMDAWHATGTDLTVAQWLDCDGTIYRAIIEGHAVSDSVAAAVAEALHAERERVAVYFTRIMGVASEGIRDEKPEKYE